MLIDAIVDCIRPASDDTIIAPVCGTGGFLLAAHAFLTNKTNYPNLTKEQREHLRLDALRGVEIDKRLPVRTDDALRELATR